MAKLTLWTTLFASTMREKLFYSEFRKLFCMTISQKGGLYAC